MVGGLKVGFIMPLRGGVVVGAGVVVLSYYFDSGSSLLSLGAGTGSSTYTGSQA